MRSGSTSCHATSKTSRQPHSRTERTSAPSHASPKFTTRGSPAWKAKLNQRSHRGRANQRAAGRACPALLHDLHGGDVVIRISDHHLGLDVIANVELLKLGVGLDRIVHGHGLHPIADLAVLDGGGPGGRVERFDLSLHIVLPGLLLGAAPGQREGHQKQKEDSPDHRFTSSHGGAGGETWRIAKRPGLNRAGRIIALSTGGASFGMAFSRGMEQVFPVTTLTVTFWSASMNHSGRLSPFSGATSKI